MLGFRLNWRGDDVLKRLQEAARKGIDDTMAASVLSAKGNHPGWRNITSTAEGSMSIYEPARTQGGVTYGIWGSRGVMYMIFLEMKHGSALRNASEKEYPSLRMRIQQHYGS